MSPWELQFSRMVRALKSVEKPNGDRDSELDDIYSFFRNAWHLKDWLKNDGSISSAQRAAIVRDAENTDSLKFCADLANGSKHLELTKSVRKGAKLVSAGLRVTDAVTGKIISEIPRMYIVGSKHGSPHPSDVIGFAQAVVQDWAALLKKARAETACHLKSLGFFLSRSERFDAASSL